ncbi:exoribonuclease II, putative [Plasmodium ovale]|uniref:Exoribonuclease II, putative n=2 Tax=Plasmodium ovale TaxID=36330 RepID=A0A1D3U7D8_PLAOA|nr:exoribonuclease II, putative [Plasmodium ovale]
MFFFKSVRRSCFYTKIYENIKIVRGLKYSGKDKDVEENSSAYVSNNKSKKKKKQNVFPDINGQEEKQFYKHIFNKIKEKNNKALGENDRISSCDLPSLEAVKSNYIPRDDRDNDAHGRSDMHVGKQYDRHDNRQDYRHDDRNDDHCHRHKLHGSEAEINNQGNQRYLREKKTYLRRKDVYLKFREECIGRNKLQRGKEDVKKKNVKCTTPLASSPEENIAHMREEMKGRNVRNAKETFSVKLSKSYLSSSKSEKKSSSFPKRETSNVKMDKYDRNEKKNKHLIEKGKWKTNSEETNSEKTNSEKTNSEKTNSEETNSEETNSEKNKVEVKEDSLKCTKGTPLLYKEMVNRNDMLIQYERYWENDKIVKYLQESRSGGSMKDGQNKLFKGTLYVSPFDTSKCFVISEEVTCFPKNKFFYVYGYISRNRALNDDIVYAYTGRRRVKKFQSRENRSEADAEEAAEAKNDTEEAADGAGRFCRVVSIVERRNDEFVCALNHVHIKQCINNTFGRKGVSNKLKMGGILSENSLSSGFTEGTEVSNWEDGNRNGRKLYEDPTKREAAHTLEGEKKSEEKTFAKIQPFDVRIPCFIYDSSNDTVNHFLRHVKKKKINLYVLVKFKKWDETQINPIGSITTILGNEKNIFSIIYFFIHFYKIQFHMCGENDLSHLKSETVVSDKLVDAFIGRNSFSRVLPCGKSNVGHISDYNTDLNVGSQFVSPVEGDRHACEFEHKIAYLRDLQRRNTRIAKYMIKSFLKNREIMTHLDVFTIDPQNAKDLDDALSVEFLNIDDNVKKNVYEYRIGVHISDVSFFVQPNSHYDKMAARMCNTLYMDLMVIHMLPPVLSEKICSLNTEGEKLSLSVFFRVGNLADPYDAIKRNDQNESLDVCMTAGVEIKRGLVTSRCKLSYDIVESFLDDVYSEIEGGGENVKDCEEKLLIRGDQDLTHFVPNFENICRNHRLSVKMGSDIVRIYLLARSLKEKTGRKNIYQEECLLFSYDDPLGKDNLHRDSRVTHEMLREMRCRKSESVYLSSENEKNFSACDLFCAKWEHLLTETSMENIRIDIVKYKKKSHMLIEEMMILTNFLVAHKITYMKNKLGLLRIHENTSDEIKKHFLKIIDYNTYKKINKIIDIKKSNISNILSICEKLTSSNQFLCLQYNILKYYREAIYTPFVDGKKDYSHFGLLLNKYIHFTSPIRRYIDIVTHRIVCSIMEKEKLEYNLYDLKIICDKCNYQKKKSDEAQVHLKNFLLNKYLIYLNDTKKSNLLLISGINANGMKQSSYNLHNETVNTPNTVLNLQYEHKNTYQQCIGNRKNEKMGSNVTTEMDNFIGKKCIRGEINGLIKKYFFMYKGVISFLTEAYIQEIVIMKNVKENICLNILTDNYITVQEEGGRFHVKGNPIAYTAHILSPSQRRGNMDLGGVEEEENSHEGAANMESTISGQNPTSEENHNSIRDNVSEKKDISKAKFSKSTLDNGKQKNAIVFYVPLLDTEKSISDNLLRIKFDLILISHKEYFFIYNVSKDILFNVLSFSNVKEVAPGNFYDEEIKSGEQQRRNSQLFDLFKCVMGLGVTVNYKMVKLERRNELQKIYDELYVHDVYARCKVDSEVIPNKGSTSGARFVGVHNGKVDSMVESTMEDKMLDGECPSGGAKYEFSEQYRRIGRFEKSKIFIIPGSQMWTLRLA